MLTGAACLGESVAKRGLNRGFPTSLRKGCDPDRRLGAA